MMKNYSKFWLLLFVTAFFYVRVSGQVPNGYYDTAEGKTGDLLKSALHNIIDDHNTYPYSSSGTDVWDILKEADRDPNNPNNVIGIYSGFSMNAAAEYDNGAGWSREHVWAKSRGDFGTTQGAGTDLHHLRAEDVSTNGARNNRNFDYADSYYVDGSGNYSGPTLSKTSSSEYLWEPRDEVKGDVARMIFYMAVRYEGDSGDPDLELTETYQSSTETAPVHAKMSTLIAWHELDPVSDAERQRNDIIYSYQQNRNPFIDRPEFACAIFSGCSGPSNSAPQFTSTPVTEGVQNSSYSYSITVSDADGDITSISGVNLPSWLSITDHGNNTATLSGTPASTGTFDITIEANDGSVTTSQTFQITITASGNGGGTAGDLFFSEYIEGSSYNKGLEIANFTGSVVSLSNYSIKKQTNGAGDWGSEQLLSGSLADGDVYVIVNSNSDGNMTSVADLVTGAGIVTFNGNDAIALFKNGVLIDVIGQFNNTSTFAQDVTLVRNAEVSNPNTTYTISEWSSYPSNTFTYLGLHEFNGGETPPPTCNTPSGFNASNITTSSAYITWNDNGADSYDLRYRIDGSTTWTYQNTSSANYSLSGLNDDTSYEYQVRANCGSISSTYSTSNYFTTDVIIISCNAPSSTQATNITTSSALISWSNTGALSYDLQYRETGSGSWNTINTSSTSYNLNGLTPNTNYEYQLRSNCSGASSGYDLSNSFSTLPTVVNYCASYGQNASEEWINRFQLANVNNLSGYDGGYGNYLSLTATLTIGSSESFTVVPGWSGRSYNEAYDIWIDFNRDGQFDDVTELVASIAKTKNVSVSGNIYIPSNVSAGTTRMRVSMKYNGNATPCEIFQWGEVEDYNVNLVSGGGSARNAFGDALTVKAGEDLESIAMYPNPVSDRLSFNYQVRDMVHITIVNNTGQLLLSRTFIQDEEMDLNVSHLKNGIYIVQFEGDGMNYQHKLIKN